MKTIIKYNQKLTMLILLLAIGLSLSNCTIIKPGFSGVLNHPFGKGLETNRVYKDGLAWKMPWNRMFKYNTQLKSYQEQIEILTSDQLHTTLALSTILKPKADELPNLILEIGKDYYNAIVKPEFYSATRGIIVKYNYEDLSSKSLELEKEIFKELQKRLQGKHIYLDKVTLDHIMYSPMVTNATDEKLATTQKLEQKSIELEIAEKDAEIQRITAKGQRDAQQIISQGLTQKYLQFKSLEVQNELTKSANTKFFFVPVGNDGLPVIIDAGSD